jgi:hypothetical protein
MTWTSDQIALLLFLVGLAFIFGHTSARGIECDSTETAGLGPQGDEPGAREGTRPEGQSTASLQADVSQMRSGIAALLKVRDGYGWCKESDDAIEALRGLVPPKAHE